jgi:hypothetical protein
VLNVDTNLSTFLLFIFHVNTNNIFFYFILPPQQQQSKQFHFFFSTAFVAAVTFIVSTSFHFSSVLSIAIFVFLSFFFFTSFPSISCSQSIFSFKSLDTFYSKIHNILFHLFYFQIASLFTYMTTRMNEWTTTHTTAAASSIDVRVSDLDLFYFWFIQFVCDYSSLFYSHHVLFWLFFFAKGYLFMYFLIFFLQK